MTLQRARWPEHFAQDVRYAWRQFGRNPLFTAVAVLTLALGIGANATMFGVVDRLLLRPPANVAAPERVVRIYFREKAPSWLPGEEFVFGDVTAYPMVTAVQKGVPSLEEVAGVSSRAYTLGRGPDAREVDVSLVTGNFFRLVGARPVLGRFLSADEDRIPIGVPVTVVSYSLWRQHFGGARDVVGREIRLDNKVFTVIGVAPEGFTGVDPENVDLWVPVSALASESVVPDWATNQGSFWIRAIGRMKADATPELVSAEATVIFRRTIRDWNQPWRDTLGVVVAGPIIAARGPAGAPPEARVSFWLVGVSGIVLLIACANVANLLLARAVRRRREIAVRLALGVDRGRLVRQLLTETLLLAALAAAAALLLAYWAGRAIHAVLLPDMAHGGPVSLRVIAVVGAATLLTVLLAGLAPALQSVRTEVIGALKAGAREGGGRRPRLQSGLLVAQAALSVVLLVGAGLFIRSLHRVRALDVGVDLERVLLVRMDLRSAGFEGPRIRDLFYLASERARQLPVVEHASLVAASVPKWSGSAMSVRIPGRDSLPALPNGGPYYSAVGPDYFATIGARVLRGRGLSEVDERMRARTALVNETVAKYYWPNDDPVGQCMNLGTDAACSEVVGVVQDVLMFSMVGDERGQIYVPLTHPTISERAPEALLVRVRGDADRAAGSLRRELQTLAPNMPYVSVRSFEELVAPEVRPWRLGASMFGIFGALALVIAAVGLYGALAYSVSHRTHELGVRMALGAQRADVVRLVVLGGVRVVALGLMAGAAGALAAGHFMAPLLFDTSPRDPEVFSVVAAMLLLVAVAASLLPAWHATRVDPSKVLRSE